MSWPVPGTGSPLLFICWLVSGFLFSLCLCFLADIILLLFIYVDIDLRFLTIMIKLYKIVTGGTMKNFFKGAGAAIGYFVLYFVINLLLYS